MIQKKKAYKGKGMEGWIARWYAKTRGNDMADFFAEADKIAASLPAGAAVLEVAPGPGFFSVQLAKLGDYRVSGLDISKTFVEIATENAAKAGVQVDFRIGDAAHMPFANEEFDLVYCSAAFKNFSDPLGALDEMHRVLRPGGSAVIVDLRKDVSMADIAEYVKQSGRSRWDAWITTQTFRHMLIKRAYTRGQIDELAHHSRFGECQMTLGPIGFEARFTKPAA